MGSLQDSTTSIGRTVILASVPLYCEGSTPFFLHMPHTLMGKDCFVYWKKKKNSVQKNFTLDKTLKGVYIFLVFYSVKRQKEIPNKY